MGNFTVKIIADPDIQALQSSEKTLPAEWERFSIGKNLSAHLIAQETSEYSLLIPRWLEDTLREKAPAPIICTDIDILFLPSLGLDPLTIFRQISRYTHLVILWPGTYKEGVLAYAKPEHQHYRFWKNLDGIEIIGANDALQ